MSASGRWTCRFPRTEGIYLPSRKTEWQYCAVLHRSHETASRHSVQLNRGRRRVLEQLQVAEIEPWLYEPVDLFALPGHNH